MLVKDYKGELISKAKARKIKGEDGVDRYFESGVSCIKMSDSKWYRTTTGKIIYDHSIKKWIFSKNFSGNYGLVEDGSGYYSDISQEVIVQSKTKNPTKRTQYNPISKEIKIIPPGIGSKWTKAPCMSAEVAFKLGYIESIYDGEFYLKSDCTEDDLQRAITPGIPQSEKVNTYSLDDDKNHRIFLEDLYDANKFKIDRDLQIIARKYIPFSFGLEIEVQNGHIPARIREPLGFRVCRDGSLDGGIEFVGIPMEGAKGLQALKNLCQEGLRRTVLSNKCSVHIHFGDVRRDRLYVFSLWTTLLKIQHEFKQYFPYSRTNSIREDGKIYAAMIPNIGTQYTHLLKIDDEEKFKEALTTEWTRLYTYLNAGHPPGEVFEEEFMKVSRDVLMKGKIQKQYCFRVQKFNYTTKLPLHAIQGQKWLKPMRYMWVNFLNLFFAHSKTVEFRICEATFNFDKILIFLLTCVAILKYAENYSITLSEQPITLKEILKDHFPDDLANQIMNYWTKRKLIYGNSDGTFKVDWKGIEGGMMINDKNFTNKLKVE